MENQMAQMPKGQPRTVPDPAGDLYDREMAKVRAQREAEDRGETKPPTAKAAAKVTPTKAPSQPATKTPVIPRPNFIESMIPVIGPAWDAAADFEEGNYGGAAFNAGMAVADALPAGFVFKGVKAAKVGIGVLKKGSVTADAARKMIRARGLAGRGEEIHHTVALNGLSRNAQDVRNHYALLKVMPKEQHRRLTGSWAGKPRYDPVRRLYYGTTDWQKVVPATLAGYAADTWENLTDSLGGAHER